MHPLAKYATTDRQREVLDAIFRLGSQVEAARELGVSDRAIRYIVKPLKDKAALKNDLPEHGLNHPLPDIFNVSRITQNHVDGELRQSWTQFKPDAEMQKQLFEGFIDGLKDDLPTFTPIDAPHDCDTALLNQFTITDYHLGLMAEKQEAGVDWDLAKAEHMLIEWFAQSIRRAPNASQALLAQLGDFLHADGIVPATPSSGHILDVSARFHDVAACAARVLRKVCDMLLATHDHVHVVMATGNHDISSSIWMRNLIDQVYSDEPRLTVDMSPDVYYAFEWGATSLFYHHGHKKRVHNVSDVFVAKFRDMFGRTDFSYGHMGHLHHVDIKENNLMVIEQHRTLAAPDAYASLGGWLSGRSANTITYHREFGEVSRLSITADMVAKRIDML